EIVPGGVPAAVHGPGPLTLELVDGRRYGEFDALLWAIGRLPNTEALALENAGITPTASGHVPADDFQNTEVEGIYAVGDASVRGTPGVSLTAAGHVRVEAFRDGGVEADSRVGDVTGRVELTPVAIGAGRRRAVGVFDGRPYRRLSYGVILTVIFLHPPIGTI